MAQIDQQLNKNVLARFKIPIFGDAGVGKTTLVNRYLTGIFKEKYITTLGMDFYLKKLTVDGKIISLQIWDFAGEEKFRFLMPSCVKGSHGAIFMFDITRYKTFENLKNWLEVFNEVNEAENQEVYTILLGGKLDLSDFREVPSELGIEFAKENGFIGYLECSSKKGINILEPFEKLALKIINSKF